MTLTAETAQTALDQVQPHFEDFLRNTQSPGLAISLSSGEETLVDRYWGFANLEAKQPITPKTRFEIGSISKSFTGILILQLVEAGLLELHAPVERYLPWFQLEHSQGTITVHHLLTHTAGLVMGSDAVPESLYALLLVCKLKPGWPPGTRFHYSNVGYKLLGAILERVLGQPLEHIIRTRILEPLGMTSSLASITQAIRPQLATGYTSQYDDRPVHSSHKRFPATFVEADTADGSIVSTAEDLSKYARMLLYGGSKLISDSSFTLLTTGHQSFGPDGSYGYGLTISELHGFKVVSHSGGMLGFTSMLLTVPALELSIVALCNSSFQGLYTLCMTTLKACTQASRSEKFILDGPKKVDLQEFAAVFEGENRILEFVVKENRLCVEWEEKSALLEQFAPDSYCTDAGGLELHPFEFQRDENGRVSEVFHGPEALWTSDYTGPKTFGVQESWLAFPGLFRSHNPWVPSLRIFVRKGELWASLFGHSIVLEPEGAEFVLQETPDRLFFDTLIEGQAQRVTLSGCEYVRVSAREHG